MCTPVHAHTLGFPSPSLHLCRLSALDVIFHLNLCQMYKGLGTVELNTLGNKLNQPYTSFRH